MSDTPELAAAAPTVPPIFRPIGVAELMRRCDWLKTEKQSLQFLRNLEREGLATRAAPGHIITDDAALIEWSVRHRRHSPTPIPARTAELYATRLVAEISRMGVDRRGKTLDFEVHLVERLAFTAKEESAA